jgi:hypoxanthine phosphoribosyltransferase
MTGASPSIQEAGDQPYSVTLATGAHLGVGACVARSRDLAQRVKDSGFQPDLVVGIREGGILPARVLADALATKVVIISVRRRASSVKHLPLVRLIGRHFGSRLVKFPLVRRFLNALNRVPGRSVAAAAQGPSIAAGMRVLLVYDFSCSDETFVAAAAWLREAGAEAELIRTAALIAAPDPARGPPFYPSYMLASVPWVFFPWSSNSPHYGEYLQWKATHAL